MNFFFTGMKHSGKTTFAKRLAANKGLLWADSDDLILQKISPLTVREFYKEFGKEAFIIEERNLLFIFYCSAQLFNGMKKIIFLTVIHSFDVT